MVELTGHAVIQKIDNLYSDLKIEIERLVEEKNALCTELKDKKNELDGLRQSLADESKAMGEELTEHIILAQAHDETGVVYMILSLIGARDQHAPSPVLCERCIWGIGSLD